MSRAVSVSRHWAQTQLVETAAKKPVRTFTMRKLMNHFNLSDIALVKNAEWLRCEMATRYAHRLRDFNRQSHVVVANPHVNDVYNLYNAAFERLLAFPKVESEQDDKNFTALISQMVKEQGGVIDMMSRGVKDFKIACPDVMGDLDAFLNRLFVTRISRRVMMEHHIALHTSREDFAGVVCLHCCPAEILRSVTEQVREICRQTCGISPHVNISGNLDTTFPFIPEHFRTIFYELLKNAMRATVEFSSLGNSVSTLPVSDEDLPPIHIEIYKGKADVIIKISDKGGGISPSRLPKIWSYGFTTLGENVTDLTCSVRDRQSELAGYGFGLPIARAYAQYFGGDIHLQSMLGHGTDTYVSLNHVGDQEEAVADFSYSVSAGASAAAV